MPPRVKVRRRPELRGIPPANKKWEPIMLVHIYKMGRQKLSQSQAAASLNVAKITFETWLRQRPGCRAAWEMGYNEASMTGKSIPNIVDYCYTKLPLTVRGIWDEMMDIQTDGGDPSGEATEQLLRLHGKPVRQRLFIHAIVWTNFNMNKAARLCNITFASVQSWLEDPNFRELLKELEWQKKNFFENAFLQKVAEGDSAAIIHAVKTQLKDRGYNEKVVVEHQGIVQHEHNQGFNINALLDDLSINAKHEVLMAMRKHNMLPQGQGAAQLPEPTILDAEVT